MKTQVESNKRQSRFVVVEIAKEVIKHQFVSTCILVINSFQIPEKFDTHGTGVLPIPHSYLHRPAVGPGKLQFQFTISIVSLPAFI